jgi:hypothetical protein
MLAAANDIIQLLEARRRGAQADILRRAIGIETGAPDRLTESLSRSEIWRASGSVMDVQFSAYNSDLRPSESDADLDRDQCRLYRGLLQIADGLVISGDPYGVGREFQPELRKVIRMARCR